MPAFPALVSRPDSSEFTETRIDPTISKDMEGGYTITRPRYTRPPQPKWKIKYTDINNSDKQLLTDHYDAQRGGSLTFAWTNPQNNTTYTVRYVGDMEFKYVGIGGTQRWNCSFELQKA